MDFLREVSGFSALCEFWDLFIFWLPNNCPLLWSYSVLISCGTDLCMNRSIKALGGLLYKFLELFLCVFSFTLKILAALAFLDVGQCSLNSVRTSGFVWVFIPWPGNCLQVLSWENCKAYLAFFFLYLFFSWITGFHCLRLMSERSDFIYFVLISVVDGKRTITVAITTLGGGEKIYIAF